MHRMRSVGALVAAAAVGVAVWLLSPAFACSPGAQLTIEGLAVPGEQATVRGSLFDPAAGEAKIWWRSLNGLLLGRAQPNADGQFVTTITIPASAEPDQKYFLVASQDPTVTAEGRTANNDNSPGSSFTVDAPPPPPAGPPLTSTATVTEPAPVTGSAPAPQREVEVASTPVPVASAPTPTAATGSVDSPLAATDPSRLAAPLPAALALADRVVPVGSGLILGQPLATGAPALVPADDAAAGEVAGPGPALSGVPSVVGTPGQPGVVLGTPPPTDFGGGRTSMPLVIGASVLGLALLGLGAELARRRATAQA